MSVILSSDQLEKVKASGINNFHLNGDGEISDDELVSIIDAITKMKNIKRDSQNSDAT